MPDNYHDHFTEELLEAALACYRPAEPRPGLEERILANLRTSPQAAPRLRRGWLPVMATAATVLIVLAALYLARRPAPQPTVVRRAEAPSATISSVPVKPTLPRRYAAARRPSRAAKQVAVAPPRQERFPSPAPLSEQELLLLRYVSLAPKEALSALQPAGGPIEPLRIEPRYISDLVVSELPREK